jgi:hypothetical protein
MLSRADSDRIAKAILSRMARHTLPLPLEREQEPRFTARVLMPRAEQALQEMDISGLTLHGDGRAWAPATVLPSCEFRPDIALLFQRSRIAAFEVKFLRGSGRQYSLAAAVGQAVVYSGNGYKAVGTILLDLAPVPGEAGAIHTMLKDLGLFSCVFNRSGSKLAAAE